MDGGGGGVGGKGTGREGFEEMKHSPRWFQLYRQQGEQAVKTGGFERPLQPNLPIAIQEVIIIFVSEGKDGVELCKKKKTKIKKTTKQNKTEERVSLGEGDEGHANKSNKAPHPSKKYFCDFLLCKVRLEVWGVKLFFLILPKAAADSPGEVVERSHAEAGHHRTLALLREQLLPHALLVPQRLLHLL